MQYEDYVICRIDRQEDRLKQQGGNSLNEGIQNIEQSIIHLSYKKMTCMTKTELGHQWDRFKQKEDRLKTFSCLSKHLSNRMTEIEN